ncbi:MAG: methyltransferase domain-containing protein [Proteobacteria bacterium]|nr:methyltransferase domain-containing protein [Pseudomonadota bacterium]
MVTVDFKKLGIKPGYKILDIGCGQGRHTASAFRYKRAFVMGADLNFSDLCKARDRLMFHKYAGEYDEGQWGLSVSDITHLPFKDHFFDIVICSEVLEHIPDDKKAASELVRVLKKGGKLVVSVPRYLPEKICWSLSDDYFLVNQGHIRIYKKKAMQALLENAGVRTWASHYAHSIHTPYWWLRCLSGPTRNDVKLVNLYKRFLDWDTLQQPRISHFLDRLLNPLIGKSVVFYTRKE